MPTPYLAAGLTVFLMLAACSGPSEPVVIRFQAQHDDTALSCGGDSAVALTDLRFYVSAPALMRRDGTYVPLALEPHGRWQQDGLALIDLEDGSGHCTNGTADVNAELRARIPAGEYRGLRFTIGVPFERNHADPLAAAAPLDDSTMHWHWRSGYKFLRAGIAVDDSAQYWMHLGSAGCQGTVQNISTCSRPNRVTVELDSFLSGDAVVVNLAAYSAAAQRAAVHAKDCSSGPSELACDEPFRSLGIDVQTGQPEARQRWFEVAAR